MIVYTCHLPSGEVIGGLCVSFNADMNGTGHFVVMREAGQERPVTNHIGRWTFRSGDTVLCERDLDALNAERNKAA